MRIAHAPIAQRGVSQLMHVGGADGLGEFAKTDAGALAVVAGLALVWYFEDKTATRAWKVRERTRKGMTWLGIASAIGGVLYVKYGG